MKCYKLEVGMLATNCYIVVNEATNEGVIVDPGGDGERIVEMVQQLGVKITAIFITHGHSDHILGLGEVKKVFDVPVYISKEDADCLTDGSKNLSIYINEPVSFKAAEKNYQDGDIVETAGLTFKVYATPGHTKGGICLHCGDIVLCGDTIFCESIGRTDLPGGSYRQLLESIKTKLLVLDDQVNLLPGHGPATTVGWERRRNPFLQ